MIYDPNSDQVEKLIRKYARKKKTGPKRKKREAHLGSEVITTKIERD